MMYITLDWRYTKTILPSNARVVMVSIASVDEHGKRHLTTERAFYSDGRWYDASHRLIVDYVYAWAELPTIVPADDNK